jgi:hypothetical protein
MSLREKYGIVRKLELRKTYFKGYFQEIYRRFCTKNLAVTIYLLAIKG